jgi:hypothetical protein
MEGFECYEYTADSSFHNFYFCSSGPRGHILKKVWFISFIENLYNISFGDFDPKTEKVNVKTVSNNGDMGKVLFTIAKIVYEFTKRYPDTRIYFTGSTASRTRLYQMTINRYKHLIGTVFEIHGWNEEEEEEIFIINKNYNSFIVFRK